jgi:hypothetical protein
MNIPLILLAIIATILLYVAFREYNHPAVSYKLNSDKHINITHSYIYKPIEHNIINVKNIESLTDIEFYILECTKNTSYSFYVIGGWLRDRVIKNLTN